MSPNIRCIANGRLKLAANLRLLVLRAGIGPFELLDDLGGTLAGRSGGALRSLSFL